MGGVPVALGGDGGAHFALRCAGEPEPRHELPLADRVAGGDARGECTVRGLLGVVRNLGQGGRQAGGCLACRPGGLVVVVDPPREHAPADRER
jgi:hypothetical protein